MVTNTIIFGISYFELYKQHKSIFSFTVTKRSQTSRTLDTSHCKIKEQAPGCKLDGILESFQYAVLLSEYDKVYRFDNQPRSLRICLCLCVFVLAHLCMFPCFPLWRDPSVFSQSTTAVLPSKHRDWQSAG